MTISVGDPAAMRSVAAAARREIDLIRTLGSSVNGTLSSMSYAGPAADRFFECVRHCAGTMPQIADRLADVAARLERAAWEAEVELAARRSAGLS